MLGFRLGARDALAPERCALPALIAVACFATVVLGHAQTGAAVPVGRCGQASLLQLQTSVAAGANEQLLSGEVPQLSQNPNFGAHQFAGEEQSSPFLSAAVAPLPQARQARQEIEKAAVQVENGEKAQTPLVPAIRRQFSDEAQTPLVPAIRRQFSDEDRRNWLRAAIPQAPLLVAARRPFVEAAPLYTRRGWLPAPSSEAEALQALREADGADIAARLLREEARAYSEEARQFPAQPELLGFKPEVDYLDSATLGAGLADEGSSPTGTYLRAGRPGWLDARKPELDFLDTGMLGAAAGGERRRSVASQPEASAELDEDVGTGLSELHSEGDGDFRRHIPKPSTWEHIAQSFGPVGGIVIVIFDYLIEPFFSALGRFGRILAKTGNDVKKTLAKAELGKVIRGISVNGWRILIGSFWVIDFMIIGFVTQIPWASLYGALQGVIAATLHIWIFEDEMFPIGHGIYLLTIAIFAQFYRACLVYQYPLFRREPTVARNRFTFGLTDGCTCDPDARICLTSVFCMPVRWADTASAAKLEHDPLEKHQLFSYWVKLLGFGALFSFTMESFGVTMLIAVVWAVWVRQQIRKTYRLPRGDGASISEDILVWLFCSPCAVMQEAMQAEFVDLGANLREHMRSGQQHPAS